MAQGTKHYFSGKPCKHGHFGVRSITRRGCPVCNREWQAKFYKTPAGRSYHLAKNVSNQPRKSKLLRHNLSDVEAFYASCPPGHEVDHILPRNGSFVCGLHQLDNLQYLPISENRKKGKRVDPLTLEVNVCVLPGHRSYVNLLDDGKAKEA